jgi:quercetin dioxygenase-like cupin family protein
LIAGPPGKEASMRRTAVMLAIALTIGIVVGRIGNHVLSAQQEPVTRTILQQKDLEGAAGKEVIMYRADLISGGAAPRHFHPGPELVYVLEGSLVLEPDGQPPVTLKAGDSAHAPAKHIHSAKNPSTTAPTKVLVFLVGEKGQPLATPAQ